MAACLEMTGGFDLIDKSESALDLQREDFVTSDRKNHVLINSYEMLSHTSLKEVDKVESDIKGAKNAYSSADKESENNSNKHIGKPNKKNLRVTFPEGNEVSGYMDPPIPWDDVSSCTTEILVSSYLRACEKFGVRPIQKLLSQLQAIANFQERNETLTLRNDHLDYRHCETLEEVLRRVQFRTIDLEATKMDDEAAVVMFDMVEYYESCVKLNISFSRSFGARGWQACARLIKKTSSLEQLDAQGCNVADHLMPFMGRALKVATSLVSLHLENTMMSGKSLATLVMILKANETLRKLHLADNKITPSDAAQIASLIKFNKNIKLLDLRNNHLQDVGLGHICEGISEQGSLGIETLVVWNNQLTYQSMNSLCRALMDTKSLQDINLGRNNITNEGIHRLKEGLLKNRSLLVIRLQAAKITCEGAVAIAEYLAETTKLSRIDLRDNDIKTGGLMALSLALKVNKSVLRVDLDKEPKKENGVKDYVNQQKNLLVDIFSCVDRNDKLIKIEEKKMQENDPNGSEVETGVLSPVQVSSPTSDASNQCNGEEWSLVEFTREAPSIKLSPLRTEEQAMHLSNIANSNNSSRSKLHLELHPSADVRQTGDDDRSREPSRSPESKLPINIPLSPMVVSQGTASLIPVKSNGVFSPEESTVALSATDSSFQLPSCEHFQSPSLLSEDRGSSASVRVSKGPKRSGKMPREKHKKFIVTKTIGHHHHSTVPGSKRTSGKNSRRPANNALDAICEIDKTANSIAGPSSDANPRLTVQNDSDPYSIENEASTPESPGFSDFSSVHLGRASVSDDLSVAMHLNYQVPDVVPTTEVEEAASSVESLEGRMEKLSMNGLLRAEIPDIS